MKSDDPAILGLGVAAPDRPFSQEEALTLALELSPPETEDQRRQIELIYRRSGVDFRGTEAAHSVSASGTQSDAPSFAPASLRCPSGPGTAARMAIYAKRATSLAIRSTRAALADSRVHPGEITHLVSASCTGFASPGWDIDLVEALGLPRTVQRTNVGFMGCHAAINALRLAEAFSRADKAARVLVCCTEVCSVHFRYDARPDQVVANALFADGSSAAVVGAWGGAWGGVGAGEAEFACVSSTSSRLIEDSRDQMGWAVGDHGFEMNLGIELTGTIRRRAGEWVREWLDSEELTIEEVGSWAVHPGGPKILSAIGEALCLPGCALDASRQVLGLHGNMSSATVLFVLEAMRSRRELRLPCVLMSFGPGITAEGLLLR
ncbi:MAG: type III polyketide synthase [Phycisphaeraceae bacterium]|nr:type III polyketide synthase [Phycisphaeraceae bacterium]